MKGGRISLGFCMCEGYENGKPNPSIMKKEIWQPLAKLWKKQTLESEQRLEQLLASFRR
jgi:hypothetical protein